MYRGSDRWATVDLSKLDPNRRRIATKLKKKVVSAQMGKKFDDPDFELSKNCVQTFYIDNVERLDKFCDEVLTELEVGPTPIILETKGDSEMWKDKRRQIDGEKEFPNGEPAGVNVIFMRIMPRNPTHKDRYACIHIGKILMQEGNGKPILTARLDAIFNDKNALWFGENISKHLMRIESSFYRDLSGQRYLGLTDFVERWTNYKYKDITDKFTINPFQSAGVMANYHDTFKGKTYFRNVVASASDWNSVEELDDEQVFYGLVSMWAQMEIFEYRIVDYDKEGLQLSCMFTIYPRRVFDSREDRIFLNAVGNPKRPPSCFSERRWPNIDSDKTIGCPIGFGDPMLIRELQRDEFHERFHAVPEGRRIVKRRRLDSDVSDADEIDEQEELRQSQKGSLLDYAKEVAPKLKHTMPLEEMKKLIRIYEADELVFAVALTKLILNGGVLKMVLGVYGEAWMNDRRIKLVETLASERFFEGKPPVGILASINALGIRPTPRLFLLLRNSIVGLEIVAERMTSSEIDAAIRYLCNYLDLPLEQRDIQLEDCAFFNRALKRNYLQKDDDIIHMIKYICRVSKKDPAPAYFRHLRKSFVESMVEHGKEGRTTVDNAVKMAIRFAGDDHRDKHDMVIALGEWKPVSEKVKEKTHAWAEVPQYRCADPNLRTEPMCRPILHKNQVQSRVTIFKNSRLLNEFKSEVAGEFVHMHLIEPKDPRSLSDSPSVMFFKAKSNRITRIYAIFPDTMDQSLLKEILSYVARKPIVTRMIKLARSFFKSQGIKVSFRNFTATTVRLTGGRSNEAICEFVWSCRFCPIASVEWMVDPLTKPQEYHAAYLMELTEAAVLKVGLDNFPVTE